MLLRLSKCTRSVRLDSVGDGAEVITNVLLFMCLFFLLFIVFIVFIAFIYYLSTPSISLRTFGSADSARSIPMSRI